MKPTEMDRVRAARAVLTGDGICKNEEMELAAFMSIFHPNIKGKRLKRIMAARRKGKT